MEIKLTKDSIDIGIVVRDAEAALHFYRDVLGFEHVGEMAMPGGGNMQRLMCGTSMVKLVSHGTAPEASNPKGGLNKATGVRYWTISVSNIDEIVKACEEAGNKIAVPITEIRPGVTIAMVVDPDGNWVEFLQT